MTGLFRVHYFDPKDYSLNMEAYSVIARNAEEAIKRANRLKSFKKYRVEHVESLGFSDE